MFQWLVFMGMRVRRDAIPFKIMFMLMVFIMHVTMLMRHRLVLMIMLVVFADVQPDTYSHEPAGDPETDFRDFAKYQK